MAVAATFRVIASRLEQPFEASVEAKEVGMAGAAHLGVALAAKRAAPRMPLWALVLGSYLIDLVFAALTLAGKERMPARASGPGSAAAQTAEAGAETGAATSTNPWSHGLFMALVWTALSALVATRVSGRRHTGAFFGLLVFSHWLVDLVSKPMTAVFPHDTGLPLLFEGSRTVGLGLYRSRKIANAVEYGSLALGLALYSQTMLQGRRRRV